VSVLSRVVVTASSSVIAKCSVSIETPAFFVESRPLYSFIYSARSCSFAEYLDWIHFKARFDSLHAAGYNSTENEPIWMKSKAL